MRCVPSITATLLVCSVACAGDSPVTPNDVNTIRRICPSLVDSTMNDVAWRPLKPYLARKDALEHTEVTCSASCRGFIPLRGGLSIEFAYVNTPKPIGVLVRDASKIYGVTLRRGDTVLARYGH